VLCVQVARYIDDAVIADGFAMGRMGFAHLVEKGHRRIGIIDTTSDERIAQDVRKGATAALQKVGIAFKDLPRICNNVSELNVNKPWKLGQQAAAQLLKQHSDLTALVGINPHLALGAYRAAQQANMKVPKDISILALENDLTIFNMTDPTISVVDTPLEDMAERAMIQLVCSPNFMINYTNKFLTNIMEDKSLNALLDL